MQVRSKIKFLGKFKKPSPGISVRRRRAVEWILVTLFFTAIGCYFTWPMPSHMSSGFYGFGNDNWGGIWTINWIHDSFWGPGKTGFAPQIQFPFGFVFDNRFVQPYDRAFSILFGGIGNGLFAYNLMMLISFPMGGMSMYAFGKYLTSNRTAALLAGVIFTASPFHLAMTMQYPAMACIFPIPVLGMALVRAFRTRRLADAAWAGVALALIWLTSYYYGWFALWFVCVVVLAIGVRGAYRSARAHRFVESISSESRFVITRGAAMAVAFALVTLPAVIGLLIDVVNNPTVYARAADDLTFTSVRPWMYVLPPHDNPLIHFKRLAVYSHLGILPIYEQSVYLGMVPSLLAFIAIVRRKRATETARFALVPLFAGAVFCVFLTLGKSIPFNVFSIDQWMAPDAHAHFPGPVSLLYSISRNFRYYGRAFVFVSMVLAAFSAIGFTGVSPKIAERFGGKAVCVLGGVLIAIVLVEFNNRPPQHFVDLSSPPWLTTIRQLPKKAVIMEYPAADYSSPRSLQYKYWQTRHKRTTVNPPDTPQAQNFMRQLDDPDSFIAGRTLSKAGVQFAIIHTRLPSPTYPPYQPSWPTDQMPDTAGRLNPWFVHYRTTSDTVVYRILKTPKLSRGAVIGFGAGWGTAEVDQTGLWRWGNAKESELPVFAAKRYSSATIRFKLTSFAEQRYVTFSLSGKTLIKKLIAADAITSIRIKTSLRKGLQTLLISSQPGPVLVDSVLHNLDKREITIRMSKPSVVYDNTGG